ncbi:MAG: T9SS type A sorting domain-containing protein [Bacteroidales bacterium]|nr:T9SS type A sorting domain-containing protein [Bacteroidales bacterium]
MNIKLYTYFFTLLIGLTGTSVSAQAKTETILDSLDGQTSLTIGLKQDQNANFKANNKIWISNPYPNPVKNIVNMNFTLPEPNQTAKLTISDLTGKTIKILNLNSYQKKISIDISNLNSGMYFLSLYYQGNLIKSKAIILGAN